jgi:hypothetical protein
MKQPAKRVLNHECEGVMFLKNVGSLPTDYTALYQKIRPSIKTAVKTSNSS